MKFKNPLIAVRDMAKSKAFYEDVLGLCVEQDFGENAVLTGGVSLQTIKSWKDFIHRDESAIHQGGDGFELYFEEPAFDAFIERLSAMPDIQYVHPVFEHRWGQRVVRFYDPDHTIIEVGESIRAVCLRLMDGGMTIEETAARMDVSADFVCSSVGEREQA